MIFQLGTALLDACVLSILINNDTYGYILTQNVKKVISISESTLYPVLRRLQKEGNLETYDKSIQGRNRRYYKITDSGKEQLEEYKKEWIDYKEQVDKIIFGRLEEDE